MTKRVLGRRLVAVCALAVGATALSGCVVAPYPGYGYGYGYGGGYRAAPPPAVIVTPRPYYGYRDGYRGGYRGWSNDPYR
jgi:hypothetical protein